MAIRVGQVGQIGDEQENRRDSLLAAIARSAEELTSGKGWPSGVIDLMADLGRITGVSRVWIFQTIEVGEHHVVQDYPFEWADKPEHVQLSMPRFNMFRTEMDNPDYRELVESRKRGEWQSVITSEMDESWFKQSQATQSILSMLTIPIMVEGQWWGTLGFDDCEREYVWSDVEIALLRTAAYLIANAVLRDKLSAKTKQFEILQGITESSAWELDMHKGHLWCSPEILSANVGLTDNLHMSSLDALRLVHPEDRGHVMESLRQYINDGGGTFRKDLRVANECGNYVWVEVIGKVARDADGRPGTLAGIAVNILKRKEEEEKLRYEARKDPLTGVDNRAVFEARFAQLMTRHVMEGKVFSLLLLDIDRFKSINDKWGHVVGDKALKHFTTLCSQSLRGSDTLARIGGEEFAILLPDADKDAGRIIGERIRLDIGANPLKIEDGNVRFTVSIGCAGLPSPVEVESRMQFFKLADYALYVAKRRGRNRLVTIEDLNLDEGCRL